MSLFAKAEEQAERLKMYIYGEAGTGKTITSLHFPNPVMIDTEKGSLHYGKYFNFHRLAANDPKIVMAAVNELLADPQGFKTLIVDPFNRIYNEIENNFVRRMKAKSGLDDYEIQPRDYKHFKSETERLVNRILALDMNIIVTDGAKIEYDNEEFMKPVGTKPDGPKKLPHMFDIVLELYINKDGHRMAKVKKDRTNTLPSKEFPFTYEAFTNAVGIEGLERAPVVIKQKQALAANRERMTDAELNGAPIMTAGIVTKQIAEIISLSKEFDEQTIQLKLAEDYSIESVLDLREDEADLFISDLTELKPNK